MTIQPRPVSIAKACLYGALFAAAASHAQTNVAINVTGSITPGTCSVNNLSIPIGNVDAAVFTSVGSSSPSTAEYAFRLNCQGSPAVTLKVSGAASPSTQFPHLFGLIQGEQSASGIGVELMTKGGTWTIYPGDNIDITQSAPATLDVPISARYVRTGPVTPGLANATMTATFSYK